MTMRFKSLVAGVLFCWGLADAGTIQPPLDEIIAGRDGAELTASIIVMADMVDNARLNEELKAQKATLAERHYRVVTALMEKATASQGPVLDILTRLEAEGKVENILPFWISNLIAFEGTAEAIETVADLDIVENVVFDRPVELIRPVKSDSEPPIITTHSQGLDVINAPAVWAMGYTGAGRLVSNIDTGVDGNHPAFSARWRGNWHPASECWFDPVYGYSFPTDHGSHGTHTMGTICGRSHTTPDTVGVAINAQWIAAGSVDYGGTTSDIIASFQWIADPDGNPGTTDDVPDAVGNSWGYSPFFHGVPHCDDTFWAVMDGCENAGVAVIFSAGNEGSYGANSLRTPADRADSYFNAFSVGAIDGHNPSYPIASFSSLGPCQCASGDMNIKPECVAPGVNVRSSVPGGGYESSGWSGTSMASPHITGSVAILRQVNPNLDVDTIKDILLQSCVDLGPNGEDNTYGHGYLDLYQAVLLAGSGFGYVEGYVYETDNNLPVQATVELVGGGASTVANSSGYYILTVPADETHTIRASYHGYVPDEYLIFVSQDETISQDFYLDPPDISHSPSSYVVSTPPGSIVERDLNIYNNGDGTLYFSLNAETFDGLSGGAKVAFPTDTEESEPIAYRSLEYAKNPDRDEPLYPPVITGQGGPDDYGHEWIDSDEPGGPPVSWVNIVGPGTPVSLGDDDYTGAISIGFEFPFYDNSYTNLYIGSNGVLTFGSGNSVYENTNIPNSSSPNNFIAMFWDDLDPSSGGSVYYYRDTVNDRFIVSFIGVPFYYWWYGTGSTNFQALLYPDGDIELNYATMNPGSHTLSSGTVGIENINASDGLQIVYNSSYMHSNLSIVISAGRWLSVEPADGTIPGLGGSYTATVTFDATELPEGIYTGRINLDSDDPDTPEIDIPVTFNVGTGGAPDIDLASDYISETLEEGSSTVIDLIIRNLGDADLYVDLEAIETSVTLTEGRRPPAILGIDRSNIAAKRIPLILSNGEDNPTPLNVWLFISPPSDVIPPGDSLIAQVTLDATTLAPDIYTGQIDISSNDPVDPLVTVPVSLTVTSAGTPDIDVSVASFNDTVQTGNILERELLISNNGTALLHYGVHDDRTWITVVPDTGEVDIDETDSLTVTFDAASLDPGTYTGTITINSDDPVDPLMELPVTLHVIEAGACDYIIGDVNGSDDYNGLDITYGVAFFKGGDPPMYECECTQGDTWYVSGDVNGSCDYNGLDITYGVAYFKGGDDPIPCGDCPPSGIILHPIGDARSR